MQGFLCLRLGVRAAWSVQVMRLAHYLWRDTSGSSTCQSGAVGATAVIDYAMLQKWCSGKGMPGIV